MRKNPRTNNLLAAFATTLGSEIARRVAAVGLRSDNAAAALVTILNHPDDSIDVLRRTLALTHSGAVRLIDALVTDGFVERRRNTQDGRSVVLHLTSLGERSAQDVLAARTSVTDEVMANLTGDQQQALAPMLEALLGSMTQDYESARRNCRFCDEGACRPHGCPVELASMS